MAYSGSDKLDIEHIEAMASSPDNIKSDSEYDFTPEEEQKLVRKIDMFLLPTIWLMYLLSYMDRTKYVPSRHQHPMNS